MAATRFKVSCLSESEVEPITAMDLDRFSTGADWADSLSRWARDAKPGDRREIPTQCFPIVVEAVASKYSSR